VLRAWSKRSLKPGQGIVVGGSGVGKVKGFAVMAIMAAAAFKANQLEVHAATAAVRKGLAVEHCAGPAV
jgi:hypothetical protein